MCKLCAVECSHFKGAVHWVLINGYAHIASVPSQVIECFRPSREFFYRTVSSILLTPNLRQPLIWSLSLVVFFLSIKVASYAAYVNFFQHNAFEICHVFISDLLYYFGRVVHCMDLLHFGFPPPKFLVLKNCYQHFHTNL